MKYIYFAMYLTLAMNSNAQKYHHCNIYIYDNEDSTHRKQLYQKQGFNDYGRVILEEEYHYIDDDGVLKLLAIPRKTTRFFYNNDTLLLKSEFIVNDTFYSDIHNKLVISNIPVTRVFHYNKVNKIVTDTIFKCGRLFYRIGDAAVGDTLTCDTMATQYFYDAIGNKTKELHMHIFLGNAEQTKHTWVYDGNKKVIREDKYEFGYWENRKFYKNWVPDYKRVYSYSDEKLVSEMETNYSDFSARDSSKYIHGYIIEDNKIKKEEIRYYSSGFTDSPYHFQSTTILQYGYYPDKRIKQEDFYDPNQANPTETKVYIYE